MTNKAKLVFNGYIQLSSEERDELKRAIQDFDRKGSDDRIRQRSSLNDEVKRILGPTSSGSCPACGRG